MVDTFFENKNKQLFQFNEQTKVVRGKPEKTCDSITKEVLKSKTNSDRKGKKKDVEEEESPIARMSKLSVRDSPSYSENPKQPNESADNSIKDKVHQLKEILAETIHKNSPSI